MQGPTSPRNGELREIQYRKHLSLKHTLKIVIRNSIYAAIGRVFVGVVKALVKHGVSRAFLVRIPSEFLSLNPLKWAAVFGGFSSFRFCLQTLLRILTPFGVSKKFVSLLAGCTSATPAFVMNKETRTEMCLYLFVRSAHTFSLRYLLPRMPKILQEFHHYDVVLMCLSSAQIAYGCLFNPNTLPKSYQGFLNRASTYPEKLIRGHSGFCRERLLPDLVDYCWSKKLPLIENFGQRGADTLCKVAHSDYSCNMWAIIFIFKNMLTMGVPLYGPLRIVSMLAFQRKRLMTNPVSTIVQNVRSMLISALFLALYAAVILRSACFGVQHRGGGTKTVTALCSIAGLATLLEPKGRRMDLALYCSMHALRSFLLTQNLRGRLPYPRHWLVCTVYLLSVGFLCYQYEEEPKLLDRRVRTALRLLLDEQPPTALAEETSPLASAASMYDDAEAPAEFQCGQNQGKASASHQHRVLCVDAPRTVDLPEEARVVEGKGQQWRHYRRSVAAFSATKFKEQQ
ncbi:conserved hypothetical protein [Leishmania mexicana MHOM/GT/2001/U1103]|uniref:Transmembrane protein 135 N-terminal domain-containing protein n=1 Tax=Leishmania mexicana (strain MHOM/GT/2001/U1103) TaxID=929439 RepID=E9ARJ1_LEIMU|nr:conserved hypothetical protein [Leishmania mexicana MHOM/GT/2001/U1103]CBZ25562.1 conserved hypothetical protein [Leishmania mexicana MHOM/GT/2001/U1103]